MTQKYSATVACVLITQMAKATAHVSAQEQATTRHDISGRWQLNRTLTDDAKEKLASMGSAQAASGHGPSRHGGFSAIFGGGRADHEQLEKVLVSAPTRLIVAQDDQKVVLTAADGSVRTLPTNNAKVKVPGGKSRPGGRTTGLSRRLPSAAPQSWRRTSDRPGPRN